MPLPALPVLVAGLSALAPVAASAAPAGVPAAAAAVVAAPAAGPAVPPAAFTTYTVRRGDTVGAIAHRAGTSVRAIVAANHLPRGGRLVRVGQVLRVPVAPGHRVGPKAPAASPGRVVTSRPAAPRPALEQASGAAVRDLVADTARRYGVDPHLAVAIAYQESGWNQTAISGVGALGTMQVMPANAEWLSQLAGHHLDLTRTRDNVEAGVLLLRYLTTAAPDLDTAIGGYYQGLASIGKRGRLPDTVAYIASVKNLMGRF